MSAHNNVSKNFFATGFAVAGLCGGSGKSLVTVGIIRALGEREIDVVPFKKGPDYIDACWLAAAAKVPCYNLDPFLMTPEAIQASYQEHTKDKSLAILEGNRGIYDGVTAEGRYSTAALAVQLKLPVVLVVNCTKTTRTISALVLGCCLFDQDVDFAGVILNQIATPRQETVIRQSIEKYTPLSVLGILPRLKKDIFPMRHLGVTPAQEYNGVELAVKTLADLARTHIDLEALTAIYQDKNSPVRTSTITTHTIANAGSEYVIGIIRDRAFQFYYQENLEYLQKMGARLEYIDALSDPGLPENLHVLYIGGGFPETSARHLCANTSFKSSLLKAVYSGLPVYAECGGLIYLGKSLIVDDTEYPMVGVFPVEFGLSQKPQAHGYSSFTVEKTNPFYETGTQIKGHEFRYSTVQQWEGCDEDLAVSMNRGVGFCNGRDGLHTHNVFALYTHVLAPAAPEWAQGMLNAARQYDRLQKGS
ncbi:MAG: cobyrinic acid a,c-diamide synthase [Desulfobulbus propionicus]|nr:MAG: cobyrinic acid a,c-diamide synthase [Desulfobulbus propionicus]